MIPGPTEILFIIGAFMLLFGPNKLPEIAGTIGEMTKKFREGTNKTKDVINNKIDTINATRHLTDDEILVNYASELGISTSGKSIAEIAQDILNIKS